MASILPGLLFVRPEIGNRDWPATVIKLPGIALNRDNDGIDKTRPDERVAHLKLDPGAGRYRPTIDRHTLAQCGASFYCAVMSLENHMSDLSPSRKSRSRLAGGIVLLLIGGIILAANLGVEVPRNWWSHLPWLLIALGGLQLAWPGSFRDRLGGYWLVVVGIYGLINIYGLFGLTWVTSWPIFIIALGLRVMLGGFFKRAG